MFFGVATFGDVARFSIEPVVLMISDEASEVTRRRFAIEPVVFDDFRRVVGNHKKRQGL